MVHNKLGFLIMLIIKTVDIATIKTNKNDEKDTLIKHPPSCPCCNSDNVYGISRVVGYFSIIDNWNKSKQQEFKKRQKGDYWNEDI